MATPTIFSFSLRDANGVVTSSRAYVGYNGAVETVNALIGNWLEMGGALDHASNAQIVAGAITIPVEPDGTWKTAPVDENDVSDVIVLNLKNASTRYVQEFVLPNFKNAQITGGKVDLTQTDLAALIALLDNSAGMTSADALNTAGQTLTALNDAFQADRKHRKQLQRLSKSFPS